MESLRAVDVTLSCRECGETVSRVLNLPANVSPPSHFTCAKCTAGKSALDGLSDTQIVASPLSRRTEQRKGARQRIVDSRPTAQPNPIRERIRQMLRTDRHGPNSLGGMTTVERADYYERLYGKWITKIEASGWRCVFCRCPLTDATVTCYRQIPGSRDPKDWEPACRSCAGRQSAKRIAPTKKAA
jgi:hypothetical protein